ncbi:alpha/beta fold hydrolase [Paenibacillus beijingensis]|uniref:Alpha/beta hydrolase n=1 Tax=Paenibacillus beijingensis TaxID=1126833 RepID=A0A0D5NEV3_9BACL|nr:alpha/beta hydrolase [Paenibacillus beijingensis]AJY73453.1 alpha/beta hydrolase [Paenibacillus beijingensis]
MNKQERTWEKTGFVFVNGAGLESRIWSKVVEGLDHPYLLVEFPHRNGSVESRKDLSMMDYVAHMKRQVDEWGTRKFVIVAHSLGGVLALKLAYEVSDRLAGFVAVGAAIPENGGSFLSVLPFPKRILMSAILRKIGTKPPASAIRSGLCNDLSSDQAAKIVQGFIPEAVRVYTDQVDASVPIVPKLYVKLTHDKEFSPSLQNNMISNLSPQSVRILETGHLPMLSDPDGLRFVLEDFLANM